MVTFKGKTDQAIHNLNIPPGFIVKTQKNAWMDDDLMKVWVEEIWFKHAHAECKRLKFENSLLTFDAFAVQLTEAKNQLLEGNTDILTIQPGCTSKCQPMDVCISKPFQHMIDWIKEGFDHLVESREMVKNSFDVCGIISCDPNKVRSSSFYQQCMEKALRNLELDHEEIEDDLFLTYDDELVK